MLCYFQCLLSNVDYRSFTENRSCKTWVFKAPKTCPRLKIATNVFFLAVQQNLKFEIWPLNQNVISFDRQKLDLSRDVYLWYHKFYICSVVQAKSDSNVMFDLQSYQGLIIDRSLVH